MSEIRYYQQVLLCEKVPIQKMVSAGRGRRRRVKIVFKWKCRPVLRLRNEGEYPISRVIPEEPKVKMAVRITVLND